MIQLLLLDIAPDPVRSGIGFTGLILVGIVVLISVAAALLGFVFLIRRLTNPLERELIWLSAMLV